MPKRALRRAPWRKSAIHIKSAASKLNPTLTLKDCFFSPTRPSVPKSLSVLKLCLLVGPHQAGGVALRPPAEVGPQRKRHGDANAGEPHHDVRNAQEGVLAANHAAGGNHQPLAALKGRDGVVGGDGEGDAAVGGQRGGQLAIQLPAEDRQAEDKEGASDANTSLNTQQYKTGSCIKKVWRAGQQQVVPKARPRASVPQVTGPAWDDLLIMTAPRTHLKCGRAAGRIQAMKCSLVTSDTLGYTSLIHVMGGLLLTYRARTSAGTPWNLQGRDGKVSK